MNFDLTERQKNHVWVMLFIITFIGVFAVLVFVVVPELQRQIPSTFDSLDLLVDNLELSSRPLPYGERITVIGKTQEIRPSGFSSYTAYVLACSDGRDRYVRAFSLYASVQVNRSYYSQTRNYIHYGSSVDYLWIDSLILEVN